MRHIFTGLQKSSLSVTIKPDTQRVRRAAAVLSDSYILVDDNE